LHLVRQQRPQVALNAASVFFADWDTRKQQANVRGYSEGTSNNGRVQHLRPAIIDAAVFGDLQQGSGSANFDVALPQAEEPLRNKIGVLGEHETRASKR
jgi:hypothetical protein